ncbi:MAG: type II toxin-antitoxin system Phd/YefM family antitoxin [Mariprofundaceae bacterium]
MHQVNIHEAKTHLSKLIQEAIAGEDVIIAKDNKPVVKLVVLDQQKSQRQLGTAKGKIAMRDDFDAPLEDFASHMLP